ncbi:phytoene/squalene synthase family protein, partial [Bifidobacterium adolescentis]
MITINNDPFQEYQKDFAYCESIIKKNSKSFYLAFSQLPKRKAQSVYAVYAFCRRADDLIDRDNNQAGLRQLERQLLDFNEGKVLNDPVWRALSVVFDNFPMVTAPFFDMLTGQRKDADFKQPETRKDLEEYCYYVAGSVGLMLLPLLTERPTDLVVPAKKLGEAMQLTNILRDVGEDYQMGRIYLTKEDMTRFGVATTMLKEKQAQTQLVALWESLAKQA